MKQHALIQNGTSTFFQQADNKYRYWYRRATKEKAGRLMLQIKAADLEAFRKTLKGRSYGEVVDIFSVGGGWYEVTSDDFSAYDAQFHLVHDGLKPWLKALNAHFNPEAIDASNMIVVKKERESEQVKPYIKREQGKLVMVRRVSKGALTALVDRYAK